jgi:hypothetical protein
MLTGHRPCPARLDAAVACGSSGSGPVSGRAPHQLPCPRWLPQGPPVSALVAGVREAAGPVLARDHRRHRPGHVCRTPSVRTAVVPEAADGQSAGGSSSLQLLYSPQGRPLARQRHDGHRSRPAARTPRSSAGTIEALAGPDAPCFLGVSKLVDDHHPHGSYYYLQFLGSCAWPAGPGHRCCLDGASAGALRPRGHARVPGRHQRAQQDAV